MADLDLWDPTVPSPFDREAQEAEYRIRDKHRKSLFEIRERLQRAMIVGDRFNCTEQSEQAVDSYTPATSAVHRVLGDAQTDVLYASNVATSLLLSRQFEGISRKDIVIQEADERLALMQMVHAMVMLQMQRETTAVTRACRMQVETAEAHERELRSLLGTRMQELEASCRRRTEAAADECFAILSRDAGRAFQLASVGHVTAQRNWIAQEEERGRANLAVEADRQLSRLFSAELAEGQGIRHRELLHRKVPIPSTALFDADAPVSTRFGVANSASKPSSHRDVFDPNTNTFSNAPAGTDEYASEVDLVPVAAAPQALPESDTSSVVGDNPNSFRPYWGWMLKSTGVLMTWQRRFFVFTTRGKLKCAATDAGPWHVVLSANNILRVEVDTYHDATRGVAPPTSQYHQYGFYVDLHDPQSPQRPKRIRFCCFSRKELNAWLTVLRRATDVIFALEEAGSIARSPARRRLDLSDERTRQALRSLSSRSHHHGDGGAAPTYRRRQQLEEELSAIEARKLEERARAQKSSSPPHRHANVSENFGSPPPYE